MFWSDKRIIDWASSGGISPYNPELVNPASIDLRLGHYYRKPSPLAGVWSKAFDFPEDGLLLPPGGFFLLHTLEYIRIPENAVAFLYMKSSMGRRGLEHLHAGYFDPGFEGEATLEIINHWPHHQLILPEMRFCQLAIADVDKVEIPYGTKGHYQGQVGPTPSWKV